MPTILSPIEGYDLEKNRWYVGRGRNGNVGLWDGESFLVIGSKFLHNLIK